MAIVEEMDRAIVDGPHAELSSALLARWLEKVGVDRWWSYEGDHLLLGRVFKPCPGDELAAELRRRDKTLLVSRVDDTPVPKAVLTTPEDLDWFVRRRSRFVYPKTWQERTLSLAWKGRPGEWELIEDSATSEAESDNPSEEAKNW